MQHTLSEFALLQSSNQCSIYDIEIGIQNPAILFPKFVRKVWKYSVGDIILSIIQCCWTISLMYIWAILSRASGCETDRNSRNKMRPKISIGSTQYVTRCQDIFRLICHRDFNFISSPFAAAARCLFTKYRQYVKIFLVLKMFCAFLYAFSFSRHRIFPG